MITSIQQLTDSKLIYLRATGPYGPNNYQLMTDFKNILADRQLLTNQSVLLGRPLDNPSEIAPEACRYDVCLIFNNNIKNYNFPDGLKEGRSPNGKFACFQIPHTTVGLSDIWATFPKHLIEQDLIFDDSRLIFERYDQQLIANHYCELCVPIL